MSDETTYDFEWNPAKALANVGKHGVTFDEAATVLLDPLALTVYDITHSRHEDRWFTLATRQASSSPSFTPTKPLDRPAYASASSRPARPPSANEAAMKTNRNRQTMTAAPDDDIPSEIDFSGATRGKFHRPGARLNLPVYLDPDVQAYLSALAAKKGIALSDLANDLLKQDIAILEAAK
jgi:uncharacterized DUF497 family protein